MITVQAEIGDEEIIALMRQMIRNCVAGQSRSVPLIREDFTDWLRCLEVCHAANVIIGYCGDVPEQIEA
jgi:predicted transcriptional regulator